MHRSFVSFLAPLALACSSPPPLTDAGSPAPDTGLDAGGPDAGAPLPPDPTTFVAGPSMNVARVGHTATLLFDGRVLIVGGETGVDTSPARRMLDSVEIFDPVTAAFTALDPLPEPRSNHAAIRLLDGRVLIAGGGQATYSSQPAGTLALASALLFDPADDRMHPAGELVTARSHFGAVLLAGGRVLVAGGGAGTHERGGMSCMSVPDCITLADSLASAEIFDPTTATFAEVAPLESARFSFTLTAIGDRAVAIGGVTETQVGLSSVEIFDGSTNVWTRGSNVLGPPREHHSAIAVGELVLVAGGKNPNVTPLDRVDLYGLAGDDWQSAGRLSGGRTGVALAALPSGAVVLLGGFEQLGAGTVATAMRFDGVTLEPFGSLDRARLAPSATLLADGRLLVCGGTGTSGAATAACALGVP